jgi:hypothetical protein
MEVYVSEMTGLSAGDPPANRGWDRVHIRVFDPLSKSDRFAGYVI